MMLAGKLFLSCLLVLGVFATCQALMEGCYPPKKVDPLIFYKGRPRQLKEITLEHIHSFYSHPMSINLFSKCVKDPEFCNNGPNLHFKTPIVLLVAQVKNMSVTKSCTNCTEQDMTRVTDLLECFLITYMKLDSERFMEVVGEVLKHVGNLVRLNGN